MNSVNDHRGLPGGVSPFGDPRVACIPANRGLSQVATSFIASQCQGIHHTPLIAWSKKTLTLFVLGRERPGNSPDLNSLYSLRARCYPRIQLSKIGAVQKAPRKTVFASVIGAGLPGAPHGGDDRDRTDGLRLAKPALSQLSYIPGTFADRRLRLIRGMVGLSRIELPTSRLSGVRSNQLSYRPTPDCGPRQALSER